AGIQRAVLGLATMSDRELEKVRTGGMDFDWHFANSNVRVSVRDELRKTNLNDASEALLVNLASSAGASHDQSLSLAEAILDFQDPDNLRRPKGAEEPEYRAAGLTWVPKNAPFESVDELQQVFGMTKRVFDRLRAMVTVYSTGDVRYF